MIIATLLAIAPAVLAFPSAHGGHLHKRNGPTGVVVPSVTTTNGMTYYIRGCYDELKSGLMALNHDISSTLSSITVENCIAGCASDGYSIAGLMNGDQCLCDNAMSRNSPLLDATQCNLNCTGNTTEVCGGTWHYDIYTTSPTAPIPNPVAPTTVGSGNGTYTSIGCFVDNTSNRTLASAFSTSQTQTPAACAATCFAQGYRLAGVEWGVECYCGNELINANLTAITDCAQACSGNSTETCGDEARINVYSQVVEPPVTPSNPPVPAPTCGNNDNNRYLYQGCYNDNTHRRTLNDYSFTSSSLTPSSCSSTCFNKGYKYAALEGGDTCYCGNNCPNSKTTSDHCNKTCSGDRNHTGGGQSQSGCLTVYKSYTMGFPQSNWPSHGGW